jgi:hypothetical protein
MLIVKPVNVIPGDITANGERVLAVAVPVFVTANALFE